MHWPAWQNRTTTYEHETAALPISAFMLYLPCGVTQTHLSALGTNLDCSAPTFRRFSTESWSATTAARGSSLNCDLNVHFH